MKEAVYNFWKNFKKHPDIWFFFVFLLSFPFSIRKVILIFPIQNTFNEYTGLYLYLSDIFFLLILALLLFSMPYNNTSFLSRYKLWINQFTHNLYLYIPAFLVLFSFISIFWSQNQSIALYRSIKLFEAYLIYLYVILRFIPFAMFHVEQLPERDASIVPRGTIDEFTRTANNCSTWNNFLKLTILLGAIEAMVAIWQFIIQHSIGIFWLKESLISPTVPGVAKLILHGQKYIRAYGLFPHPNILGGFLLFSLVITLLYKNTIVPRGTIAKKPKTIGNVNYPRTTAKKISLPQETSELFHVEQFERTSIEEQIVLRGTINQDDENGITYFSLQKIKIRKIWFINSILWLQVIALLLSFSKSAIIGLLIALVYIKILYNVPRGTLAKNKSIIFSIIQWKQKILSRLFHVEQLKKVALVGLILLLLVFLTKPNLNDLFFQSLEERMFYVNASPVVASIQNLAIVPRGTIHNLSTLIFGIGLGQFVLSIPEYTKKTIEIWQFQPVHNIYLEMWSELGLIGLGLFLWLVWKLFHNCSTWNNCDESSTLNKIVPRGTIEKNITNLEEANSTGESVRNYSVLYNESVGLSIETTLRYFQGILLGLLFIGLFDHYTWDIWPGQMLLWLVMGIIAGIKKRC